MIEVRGKYCKDVKIFTDNIEESALKMIYEIADEKAFEGGKIRIMPDVHSGVGIVIGFSSPIDIEKGAVNPAHVGCDVGFKSAELKIFIHIKKYSKINKLFQIT